MNKIVVVAFMSLFASTATYASENYDLRCTFDSGYVMTISHGSGTVYIELLGKDDDPDEGGSVIKLDIPSGGAQQTIDTQSFALRGTDDDIEGAVAVVYEKRDGKSSAYFSVMNSLGKETENHACIPNTIKASNTLLTAGISDIKTQSQKTQTDESRVVSKPESSSVQTTSPIKTNVSEILVQYGTFKKPLRTVNITSISDNLIINSVAVNRDQCSPHLGNPKQAFELPFGKTVTYGFHIKNQRCDVVEVVIKTNKGDWTVTP